MRSLIVLVMVLFFGTAYADEGIKAGKGLLCDTKEQVIEAVKHFDEGRNGAEEVNKKHPNACGIFTVAYRPKEKIGEINSKHGTLDIVAIEVIGVHNGVGWMRINPIIQYTAVEREQPKPEHKPSAIIQL